MFPSPPPEGLTVRGFIEEVYDGDTITFVISRKVKVRLLDCWAPEVRTLDDKEKVLGLASRDHLRGLALGKQGILFVPGSNKHLGDVTSLGRVLGHVWLFNDDRSLSEIQVDSGHANYESG